MDASASASAAASVAACSSAKRLASASASAAAAAAASARPSPRGAAVGSNPPAAVGAERGGNYVADDVDHQTPQPASRRRTSTVSPPMGPAAVAANLEESFSAMAPDDDRGLPDDDDDDDGKDSSSDEDDTPLKELITKHSSPRHRQLRTGRRTLASRVTTANAINAAASPQGATSSPGPRTSPSSVSSPMIPHASPVDRQQQGGIAWALPSIARQLPPAKASRRSAAAIRSPAQPRHAAELTALATDGGRDADRAIHTRTASSTSPAGPVVAGKRRRRFTSGPGIPVAVPMAVPGLSLIHI